MCCSITSSVFSRGLCARCVRNLYVRTINIPSAHYGSTSGQLKYTSSVLAHSFGPFPCQIPLKPIFPSSVMGSEVSRNSYSIVSVRIYAASSLFTLLRQPQEQIVNLTEPEEGRSVNWLAPAAVSLCAQPPMYSIADIHMGRRTPPTLTTSQPCVRALPYRRRRRRNHQYRSSSRRLPGLNELTNQENMQG